MHSRLDALFTCSWTFRAIATLQPTHSSCAPCLRSCCLLYSYSTPQSLSGRFLYHSLLFIASCSMSPCNRRTFIDLRLVKGVFSVLLTRRISTRAYVGDFLFFRFPHIFDQSPHNFECFTLFHSLHTLLSRPSCTSCLSGTFGVALVEARSLFSCILGLNGSFR
jgi:hypothetical protein